MINRSPSERDVVWKLPTVWRCEIWCILAHWNEKIRNVSILEALYLGCGPFPVTVTTKIITFSVGEACKPSFTTVTGKGPNPTWSSNRGNKKIKLGISTKRTPRSQAIPGEALQDILWITMFLTWFYPISTRNCSSSSKHPNIETIPVKECNKFSRYGQSYCWWKKSCTSWDVQNLVNNGIKLPINWLAGFLPSTVSNCGTSRFALQYGSTKHVVPTNSTKPNMQLIDLFGFLAFLIDAPTSRSKIPAFLWMTQQFANFLRCFRDWLSLQPLSPSKRRNWTTA